MTKEELEKEAEKWLCNNLHSASEEDFIKAMVDFAEPREKRIAELEKENAELRAKESFVGDQNRKLCEQQQKIEVLEAENAELKRLKRECETSLCRAEYQYNYEQLTKAKKILKKVVTDFRNMDCVTVHIDKTIAEAEQFLNSEVEK